MTISDIVQIILLRADFLSAGVYLARHSLRRISDSNLAAICQTSL